MTNVVDILRNFHMFYAARVSGRGFFIISLLMAAILPSLCSCHRSNETDCLLSEIEDKLYVRGNFADTARCLVDSICSSTPISERGEALKNLILSETNVWPNLTQDDDSIESHAVDYFKQNGDKKLLMRAQIQRGYARIHLGQPDKAIIDALDALRYASAMNDSMSIGRAELLLANIYRDVYRSDLSIPHRERALKLMSKFENTTPDFLGTQYAIIAWDYHNIGNNARSITILDSLLTTKGFEDPATKAFIRNTLMYPCVVTGQFDKARQQFDSIREYYRGANSNKANWDIVIQMFRINNQPDSVRYYLDILKDNNKDTEGNWFFYEFSHLIEAEAGDYESAYRDLLISKSIMESRRKRSKMASPEVAERDYWDATLQAERKDALQRKRIALLVLFGGLVVLFLGLIKYIGLKRKHRMEIEENLFNVHELQKALEQVKKTDTDTIDVIKSAIDPINVLSTEYFAYMDCPYDGTSKLLERIGKEMENLRTNEYMDKIVVIADTINNGELNILSQDIRLKLKPVDVYLLALKLLSFSPKSICWFLKIKPAAYYTRWKRVKHKIKGESTGVGEEILLKIEEL